MHSSAETVQRKARLVAEAGVASLHCTSSCWCRETRWQICFRTPRFGLIRCAACGCFRIDPPVLEPGDDARDFYTAYYSMSPVIAAHGPPKPGQQTSRFWRVAGRVASLRPIGRRVLDIACGDGQLCAELRTAGWPEVMGLDASGPRVEAARNRYPEIAFYNRSLPDDSFAVEPVDLTVMDNVIEHFADPPAVLEQVRSFLGPQGRLVIITPNMESGHFRLLGRRWTPELAPHAHIFLFTTSALGRLLSRIGFEVEAAGSFHLPFYSWVAWATRLGSGDIRGAVWRAMQEAGGVYGRLIGAGEMLFAVARKGTTSSGERGRRG